jgi:hypothetical protein
MSITATNSKESPGASIAHRAKGSSDMDSRTDETFIAFLRATQP